MMKTKAPSAVTTWAPTTIIRADESPSWSLRRARRRALGSWAPATRNIATPRASPNTPPTIAPIAGEPERIARAIVVYTDAVEMIVAAPRPSWNPKPSP